MSLDFVARPDAQVSAGNEFSLESGRRSVPHSGAYSCALSKGELLRHEQVPHLGNVEQDQIASPSDSAPATTNGARSWAPFLVFGKDCQRKQRAVRVPLPVVGPGDADDLAQEPALESRGRRFPRKYRADPADGSRSARPGAPSSGVPFEVVAPSSRRLLRWGGSPEHWLGHDKPHRHQIRSDQDGGGDGGAFGSFEERAGVDDRRRAVLATSCFARSLATDSQPGRWPVLLRFTPAWVGWRRERSIQSERHESAHHSRAASAARLVRTRVSGGGGQ